LHYFDKGDALISNILKYATTNEAFEQQLNQEQITSYKKLDNIFSGFLNKATFRKAILNNEDNEYTEINILDVTPLYTHFLIVHLTYVLTELTLFEENSNPSEISAISNFINWKERIGRERALGIIGFNMKEFNSDQFTRDFKILLSEQRLNKRSFLALASNRQKSIFDMTYITNNEINSVHEKFESNEKPMINAEIWFELVTSKMDMMHKIELDFLDQICNKNSLVSQTYKTQLENKERSLILDFPFFRNLSEDTIHELFKLSNLKTYKKGSLLFLEGEPASRIYVIISGWIKIFKSTSNGNETVEQMLSTGNLVIESSIFTSDKYFSSAQISNDSKLMSFPASIYRNLLNSDLALALNSLKYLSQTSRTYLNQIDNNRLKSSKERVGSFLLKQFIEQKNPNTILLPYEKSIIASLLDMKPETFSRSLKSFKNEGLSTEKHQVQIKDIKTLCQYCDVELATHCQFKNKHDCKYK
jgi:CRP-like cAMP-binding protein